MTIRFGSEAFYWRRPRVRYGAYGCLRRGKLNTRGKLNLPGRGDRAPPRCSTHPTRPARVGMLPNARLTFAQTAVIECSSIHDMLFQQKLTNVEHLVEKGTINDMLYHAA